MLIKVNNKELNIKENPTSPLDLYKLLDEKIPGFVGAIINNKQIVEVDYPITSDCEVRFLTKNDKEAMHLLNHSTAHLLAEAVLNLYPNSKLAIGPTIEDGFYYDIDFVEPISDQDLEKITKEMKRIAKEGANITRKELSKKEALAMFKNNPYKVELINELPEGEVISTYTQNNFTDLCRGGHLSNLNLIKHFALINLAGAYWRGNSKNKQLTRIYGCSFWTKEELDKHLVMLKERKERDHRKLGKDLELFFIDSQVGQGLPFWLENGATIRRIVERYIIDKEVKAGYTHVYTPVLANVSFYQTSGHWDHYHDSMFPPMEFEDGERLVLRPMNCPHHMMIFKNKLRSYRDLPLRIAELGMMHRFEKSGALSGLSRVREMTLNDAHIFVEFSQIEEEFKNIMNLLLDCYKDFKITDYRFRLSYRDPNDKEKYFPDDQMWNDAEAILKRTMDKLGLTYFEAIGEAAFYGPKLDIEVKTALGHEETLSTIQLDFLLPRRFNLTFINNKGVEETPVVMHRGILSTMERFLAYLVEEYKGVFPFWLAPEQIVVIPVNEELHLKYAKQVIDKLNNLGIRVRLDNRQEKLGYLIRDNIMKKIPYQLIIGDNELKEKTVTFRKYGTDKNETMKLTEFLKFVDKLNKSKA